MLEKSDDIGVQDEIYKICKPHFEQALQEKLPNSMSISKKPIKLLIRFNNYRREQKIEVYKDSTIEKIKNCYLYKGEDKVTYVSHTKMLFVHDYQPQVTIQLGKRTLTGIWHQKIINGQKQAYVLEAENLEQVDQWFNEKKLWIENSIDVALKAFIKEFKIPIYGRFHPVEKRKEIEVKGEEYIDSLPADLILHDTVGKKVYNEGFEFKNEIFAKNYIKNRAVEDIAPQITEELKLLRQHQETTHKTSLEGIEGQIKMIVEVMHQMAYYQKEQAAGLTSVINLVKPIQVKEEKQAKHEVERKMTEYIG